MNFAGKFNLRDSKLHKSAAVQGDLQTCNSPKTCQSMDMSDLLQHK